MSRRLNNLLGNHLQFSGHMISRTFKIFSRQEQSPVRVNRPMDVFKCLFGINLGARCRQKKENDRTRVLKDSMLDLKVECRRIVHCILGVGLLTLLNKFRPSS